jgi:hypothetical protein
MALTQVQSQMIGGNNAAIPSSTAVGNQALNSNSGGNNTAVGFQAGFSNTTATRNTLVGQIAGYALTTGSAHAVLGDNALKAATTAEGCVAVGTYALAAANGTHNTAVGAGAGELITSGTKNSILGRYNGNQGGLDIRTLSNQIVLSDGDGNPSFVRYAVGNVSTSTVDIAPSNSAVGGLHFVSGFNTSGGAQAWWLIATRVNSVTIIASSNATGLTVNFGQTASVRLNAATTSGTINMVCTTIS